MRLIALSTILSLFLLGCGDSSTAGSGAGGSIGAGGRGPGAGIGGEGGASSFTATLTHTYEPQLIDVVELAPLVGGSKSRVGAENHYFFCGRDIIGYKAFNVPIERVWQILNESQKGLSGVETHARLSITHYKGKTEVAAVTNEPIPGLAGSEDGVLIFKILRNAADAPDRAKVCIVGRNPDAIWFDDYEDRIIYDEAGLFDYSRVEKARLEVPVTIGAAAGR